MIGWKRALWEVGVLCGSLLYNCGGAVMFHYMERRPGEIMRNVSTTQEALQVCCVCNCYCSHVILPKLSTSGATHHFAIVNIMVYIMEKSLM